MDRLGLVVLLAASIGFAWWAPELFDIQGEEIAHTRTAILVMGAAVSLSFPLAVFVSGPVAALLFQVVAAIHIGYVDPFFLIALVTSTLLGWAVSFAIGIALRIGNRRTDPHSDRSIDPR